MTTQEVKRKLTVILSADVKGYSRLMGMDEEATARTLNTYKEVMAGLIQHHHGRVVDSPGDNLLAEFASVVDAVRCAVEIQKELKTRNADLPENRRMEFRIGVNLGDVIEEGEKILGDGVNIAARMESLSEAGGICISGTAYDQVENKLSLGYEYLGEQTVKNITKPVRVYRVLMEPEAAGKVVGEKKVRLKQWRRAVIGSVAVVIVVVAAVAIWRLYFWSTPPPVEVASKEKMAFPLPDKPSIAVLPFTNMSGDPKEEYFSDGLTEQIITSLSKFRRLFVIARNSTFVYKGKPVKVQKVAEDLGVRYVLEGGIQKSGDRVRITAQLIDAITGRHVWSEHYDREPKDIFALQDEITLKIAQSMRVELTEGEQARYWVKWATGNLKSFEKNFQGADFMRRMTKQDNDTARQLFEEAVALDPKFVWPYVNLGWTHFWDAIFGWSESRAKSLQRAFQLAQKAVAMEETIDLGHSLLASIYLVMRQHDKAVAEGERAVALNPNGAMAYVALAGIAGCAGKWEESISYSKQAIRLSPFSEPMDYWILGRSYFMMGQHDEAIITLKKAVQINVDFLPAHVFLAACYSSLGRDAEATAAAKEVLRINPKFSVESYAKTLPYKNKADIGREVAALLKAGLPEKPSASIPPSPEVAPKEKVTSPLPEKATKPPPPPVPKMEVASKEKMAFPLPEVPSIAVLPFVNMSGDPTQEFFSDGMTEEIITALSKLPGLFVIARTSTSTYKGKPVKVKQVAEELGVQYVLEGSVQKSTDRIRINAQLINAFTGRHIWAERYDRNLKDIFALQDEITIKILDAVRVKLVGGDVSRYKTRYRWKISLDCYLKLMQAMGYSARMNPADNNSARGMVEEAIAMCPENPIGYVSLGQVYYFDILLRNTKSPRETLEKAIELAQKALAMDDSIPETHGLLCRLYSLKGELDKAIAEGERAVALNPSGWGVLTNYGNTLTQAGRPDEAIPLLQKVIRLNPLGPAYIYTNLGAALRMTGRFEEAVSAAKKATQFAPDSPGFHTDLAATYLMMGRDEDARAEVAEVLRINPRFPADFAPVFLAGYKDPTVKPRIIDALRKAGLK
jgi:adenylate cyclase